MRSHPGIWIAVLLLLAPAAACRPRVPPQVVPDAGAPGTSAVVRVPGLEPGTKPEAVAVTVGGQPATVSRVEAPAGIEFLVPERAPGPAEVAVRLGGRDAGQVPFTVLAAPARQLLLTMTGERIELVADRGAASLDRPSRELPGRRGLAYDVVARDGRLIATGVVPHPLDGRREVHEAEGVLHGVRPPASASFRLRIPALPQGGVVRFFELEPGTDLATAAGRAARRLLAEVQIGG
jgi:hypothetical protein